MPWRFGNGTRAEGVSLRGGAWGALRRAVGWLFGAISALGVVSEDPEVRRRQGFVNIGAVLAGFNSFQHMIEQGLRDFDVLAPLVFHNAIFGVLHILTPLFHRVSENAAAIWLCSVIIVGTAHVIWLTGLAGGAHVYFAFTAGAFLFFGVKNWGHYLAVVVAVLTVVIGALALAPERGPIAIAAPGFTEQMAAMVVVNVILINVLLFTYALVQTYRAENALAAEVRRADALLLAILPLPIAQKLKVDPKHLVADRHEAVTIFFADIVGFTKSAQTVAPEVLVAWLDTLIKAIDELAAVHKVEKIKTIGDAYMAASGMRVTPEVGAERMARFALAFRDLARAYGDLQGKPLGVRVGLHTGPVVAGVIGGTRFAYDLWGDTVNTASRMESHGAPDKIQISEATRALLGAEFVTTTRGVLAIKSIGSVETFWLDAAPGQESAAERDSHAGTAPSMPSPPGQTAPTASAATAPERSPREPVADP